MTAYVSNSTHDYETLEHVPVIASFNQNGNMMPIYVGIDGQRFKIVSACLRSGFNNVMDFNCQINDGNYIKPIRLIYYKDDGIWALKRK